VSWINLCLFSALVAALTAAPRPYLRHKNQNPAAYLSREMPVHFTWGEVLFRSPYILGKTGKSCNTCHPNGATTGEAIVLPNQIKPLRIVSLRGIRYRAPYGHDGRTASLREFIRDTVERTFGGAPLSNFDLDALTQYTLQQDFLPNPKLDSRGKLGPSATADELAGERKFNELGCASCHVPERYFTDGKVWRLAGFETASPYSMENGVKTATLLRPSRGRYLHDGRATATDAMEFHSMQLGLQIALEARAPLAAYLAALGHEEKPTDERHITERAMEIHSWLKIVGKVELSPKALDLLVRTLVLDLKAVEKTGIVIENAGIFRDYFAELEKARANGRLREFASSGADEFRFLK